MRIVPTSDILRNVAIPSGSQNKNTGQYPTNQPTPAITHMINAHIAWMIYCSQPLNWRRTLSFHKGLSSKDFCFSSVILILYFSLCRLDITTQIWRALHSKLWRSTESCISPNIESRTESASAEFALLECHPSLSILIYITVPL